MKHLGRILLLAVGCILSLLMAGCAQSYVMKMQNGTRITTSSKPKMEHGYYVFKDSSGRKMQIPAGKVREIEPSSMAQEEKPQFSVSTPKK
jgi:hypothetical protein